MINAMINKLNETANKAKRIIQKSIERGIDIIIDRHGLEGAVDVCNIFFIVIIIVIIIL